jgi:hypothetical protein
LRNGFCGGAHQAMLGSRKKSAQSFRLSPPDFLVSFP